MKAPVRSLLLTVLASSIAACQIPDTTMQNGAITLYGSKVVLRVLGSPKAAIEADGSLAIGDKDVAVTPAERNLLVQYNQSVRSVHETGVAMGKAGGEMALKAVEAKLEAKPDKADRQAQAGAGRMKKLSLDICKAEAGIKSAQDQLAAQLPAFKPYASIVSASDVANCAKDD
ncbi:hypothetical protein QMK61_00675 [Fulvimonas sp. R45]|uniref:hypothetical protein n=1 Tax=Fulvimonas sp. R45 TaxID=3045937 RepID=UPI00265E14F0|nr:hypothetical protein [Fulvimonas sp. R45]MDO1527335.1 hypothetical protein [Fulvimonas sp. R45]